MRDDYHLFSNPKRCRLPRSCRLMDRGTAYTAEFRRLRVACSVRTDFRPGISPVPDGVFRLLDSFFKRFCFPFDIIQCGSLCRIGRQDCWIVLCLTCNRGAKVGVYEDFVRSEFFDCGLVELLFLLPRV